VGILPFLQSINRVQKMSATQKIKLEKVIPEKWKVSTLGEACKVIMGQSPSSESYNENSEGLPFFQGKTEFTDLHPVARKWCSAPGKIAEKDDVLLTVRAPIGPTNIADQTCCIGRGLAAIRYPPNYKYLFYYLRSQIQQLDKLGTGTTFRAISGENIRNYPFPIPPLPTQHRIVEKIEELFSELDYAITTLKTTQQQLQTYRQSVLKHAFEGHFTRGNNELKEVKLGTLIKNIKYGTSQKCMQEKRGLPVLRIPNVIAGEISTEDLKYAEFSQDEIKQLSLVEGDILIIRSNGSIGIVGKAAKVTKKVVGYLYAGYLIRIRPDKNLLNSDYINYLFQSRIIRDQIESKAKSTSGVNNVNAKELQDLTIPYFNLNIQNRIVSKIETRLSQSDYLLQTINQQLTQAESLRQSILQQAFSGEL
jgi:type I restriction enzyme S subunit